MLDEAYYRNFMARVLKKVREDLNLSPKELARKLGYQTTYIYNFEAERQPLNYGVMDFIDTMFARLEMEDKTKNRVIVLQLEMLQFILNNKARLGTELKQYTDEALLTEREKELVDRSVEMAKSVHEKKCRYVLKDADWVMSLFVRPFVYATVLSRNLDDKPAIAVMENVCEQMHIILDEALFEEPYTE